MDLQYKTIFNGLKNPGRRQTLISEVSDTLEPEVSYSSELTLLWAEILSHPQVNGISA